jgi:TPR repeat protein
MSDNDFVLPRSLEPERLEPPSAMGSRRHKLHGPLIILITIIFATPIGYYFGETMAIGQPSATGAQAPPSSKTIRVLDPEEIELLMKQGEQFIAAGDVVTARIVFQRAAEAGNANAAMALGATYDPTVLAKLGVVGMSADVEKARSWYQTAEKLGSPEARRRLDVLADR